MTTATIVEPTVLERPGQEPRCDVRDTRPRVPPLSYRAVFRSRHELKYVLTEAQAVAIVTYIRPLVTMDRHSGGRPYTLTSVYLDSTGLRLCRDTLEGLKNRYKLRIRSYGDTPGSPCFFEVKRRIDRVIIKSRARAPQEIVPLILARRAFPAKMDANERRNLEQFLYYRQIITAEPVVGVRYRRQAFETRVGDDVRLTFDRDLKFCTPLKADAGLTGGGWVPFPENNVIFEIKFTDSFPAWLSRLVQRFGLVPQSVSKYARSAVRACRLHFYDPNNSPRGDHGLLMALP
jgi:hypothetical protein